MDQKFLELEKEFSEFRFKFSPEFARLMGEKIQTLGELDDNSLNGFEICFKKFTQILELLNNEIKYEELKDQKVSYQILKIMLESYIENYQYNAFLCPVNDYESPLSNFVDLISSLPFEDLDNYLDYIGMLKNFPNYMQQNIDVMKEGLKLGYSTPKIGLSGVLQSILNIYSNKKVEETIFYQIIDKQFPQDITQEKQNQIKQEIYQIIKEKIIPILEQFHLFIKDQYIPQARTDIACKSQKNGLNMYYALLKSHTTTNYTAQQIFDMGQQEVQRIKCQMTKIMEKLGYNGGSLREFTINYLKKNEQFFCKSREELLEKNKDMCKKSEEKIQKIFSTKMSDLIPYEIVMSKFHNEDTAPPAYYLYLNNKGYFYVNTGKLDTRGLYDTPALVLHEAVPGHHYQQAILERQSNLPKCRTIFEDRKYYQFPSRLPFFTGYIEGWGLYSEYLGEEIGFYENDYELFGRYGMEILRACRLVVDTGMHQFDWTYEQGVQFMLENTIESQSTIEQEVKRYIYWPGQACAYKVGEIKIKELRRLSEQKLGNKFCVKEFHDVVLQNGPVPLQLLEDQINQWIQGKQQN